VSPMSVIVVLDRCERINNHIVVAKFRLSATDHDEFPVGKAISSRPNSARSSAIEVNSSIACTNGELNQLREWMHREVRAYLGNADLARDRHSAFSRAKRFLRLADRCLRLGLHCRAGRLMALAAEHMERASWSPRNWGPGFAN